MEHNNVRHAMSVILLNTDPHNDQLLHSVRVIEKFVSDKLAAAEEKRRAISYNAMDAVRSNSGQRPKVSPAKVQMAIELLQGGWLSHRELSNRVKLKIGTVRTTLIPAIKREIPHSLKFKRERFGAQGKYKYHLKDIRAFK